MKAASAAYDHLQQKGSYSPKDLKTEKPYRDLIDATRSAIQPAITDAVMPEAMSRYLSRDNHVFSAIKTNAQLQEVSRLLVDEHGLKRPYENFQREVLKLNAAYNKNYLEAEYLFATQSAQMAGKWAAFDENSDRYNLQYRTAKDDRVRASHQILDETTLPASDPFWSSYYPPNGWRCRCTTVEVRKSKYPEGDSATAIANGEKATTELDKNGRNTLELFRFNPGKDKVLMPPNNPYTKVEGAAEAATVSSGSINLADYIKKDEVNNKNVSDVLKAYADMFPEDFRNGLEKVAVSQSGSYLMQHSMRANLATGKWVSGSTLSVSAKSFRVGKEGTIFNPAEELKGALLGIKKGQDLSFNQEYAMEALWHEILHAKTQNPPQKMSSDETRAMETVNQFCARHTYDTFIERLGGKAKHKVQILDEGYGYSTWVREFRTRLSTAKISEDQAVSDLMPELLSDYKSLRKKTDDYLKGVKPQ